MTATDELRRLLDERGVEHEDSELIDHGNRTTTYYTEWGGNDDGDGANVYVEYMDGTVLRMFDATPEQAIDATLGNDGLERSNDGVAERGHESCGKDAEQVERSTSSERESNTALKAENAKLRELVRDIWSAYHDGATNREFRALLDRLRELGVD